MLGDSIMNDVQNSPWDLLINRELGQESIAVFSAVRGSMGCRYYLDPVIFAKIQAYRPELAMICTRSGRCDYTNTRALIQRLREACDTEVLLMTDPFGNDGDPRVVLDWTPPDDWDTDFVAKNAHIARELEVNFLDLHGAWRNYIATTDLPYSYFLRDIHHANRRGQLVVAHILARYCRV